METPNTVAIISDIFKYLDLKDVSRYSITNKANNIVVMKYATKKIGNPLTTLNKVTNHFYEGIDSFHHRRTVYLCSNCEWICEHDGYDDKIYAMCDKCNEYICSECQWDCFHYDCGICDLRVDRKSVV